MLLLLERLTLSAIHWETWINETLFPSTFFSLCERKVIFFSFPFLLFFSLPRFNPKEHFPFGHNHSSPSPLPPLRLLLIEKFNSFLKLIDIQGKSPDHLKKYCSDHWQCHLPGSDFHPRSLPIFKTTVPHVGCQGNLCSDSSSPRSSILSREAQKKIPTWHKNLICMKLCLVLLYLGISLWNTLSSKVSYIWIHFLVFKYGLVKFNSKRKIRSAYFNSSGWPIYVSSRITQLRRAFICLAWWNLRILSNR